MTTSCFVRASVCSDSLDWREWGCLQPKSCATGTGRIVKKPSSWVYGVLVGFSWIANAAWWICARPVQQFLAGSPHSRCVFPVKQMAISRRIWTCEAACTRSTGLSGRLLLGSWGMGWCQVRDCMSCFRRQRPREQMFACQQDRTLDLVSLWKRPALGNIFLFRWGMNSGKVTPSRDGKSAVVWFYGSTKKELCFLSSLQQPNIYIQPLWLDHGLTHFLAGNRIWVSSPWADSFPLHWHLSIPGFYIQGPTGTNMSENRTLLLSTFLVRLPSKPIKMCLSLCLKTIMFCADKHVEVVFEM